MSDEIDLDSPLLDLPEPVSIVGRYIRVVLEAGPVTYLAIEKIQWFGVDVFGGRDRPSFTRIYIDDNKFVTRHRTEDVANLLAKGVKRA
jgi:hypothetical protein